MTAIKSNGRRKENKKGKVSTDMADKEPESITGIPAFVAGFKDALENKPTISEPPANKKYMLRSPQFEITECCGRSCDAVYYNPQNKVVQCHHCGHVYRPI